MFTLYERLSDQNATATWGYTPRLSSGSKADPERCRHQGGLGSERGVDIGSGPGAGQLWTNFQTPVGLGSGNRRATTGNRRPQDRMVTYGTIKQIADAFRVDERGTSW